MWKDFHVNVSNVTSVFPPFSIMDWVAYLDKYDEFLDRYMLHCKQAVKEQAVFWLIGCEFDWISHFCQWTHLTVTGLRAVSSNTNNEVLIALRNKQIYQGEKPGIYLWFISPWCLCHTDRYSKIILFSNQYLLWGFKLLPKVIPSWSPVS